MSFFWKSLQDHQHQIERWSPEQGLSSGIGQTCRDLCQTLRSDAAFAAVADPQCRGQVLNCRNACVDKWSNLNSLIEHETAAAALATTNSYEEFLTLGKTHWLLQGSCELVEAEQALLRQHGVALEGQKVCMIGPGAIPYTGLALAQAGATVDLVDMYGPACDFSRRWLQQLFPRTTSAIHQMPGQDMNYSTYDVVVVASMLLGREDVLRAIRRNPPKHVIIRSTESTRPLCVLLNQVSQDELDLLQPARLLGRSNPPAWVGNISLLYQLDGP